MSVSQADRLTIVQGLLNEVRAFPCVSSTHVALNLPALLGSYCDSSPPGPLAATPLPLGSPRQMIRGVGMSLVTYIALDCLSKISYAVNGAVGAGKVTLSLLTVVTDYAAAQRLLEEGTFHLLVAVSDFAIAYLTFARAVFAVAAGMIPEETRTLFQKVYRPWGGAIEHETDATGAAVEEDRRSYSYLQGVADAVQCLVMPNEGKERFTSAFAAIRGSTNS